MMLAAALAALHLLPFPQTVVPGTCASAFSFTRPLRVPLTFDPAAYNEINERWTALGLPPVRRSSDPDVRILHVALPAQAYRMETTSSGIRIEAGDSNGAFYAAMTLAQLPSRIGGRWQFPCVRITDRPALVWRVLSDDISRGPLPTMRYFKERIRTIAAFKMNGYSLYMEHVFVDPNDPLPAPLDGITPAQLRELSAYASRYHVTFIPEQQTFAHMHNTLRLERYAAAAEEPHSFLLSPASQLSLQYETRLVRGELSAVPHPPFFHIGSDETSALGDGQSKAVVQKLGLSQVYAAHIRELNDVIKPSGARVMLWDDGIQRDPGIMKLIPKNAVVINWHYGALPTFKPFIDLIASGGFDQMVAPGDSNWNQIYPNIHAALENERVFIGEGKRARVLGLFQTVWHDDGESLFEATWYPVLYAAANAWENRAVDSSRFQADFSYAFFGSGEGYGRDIADLADIQARMADAYDFSSNYLMWADPFDPIAQAHMQKLDLRALRLKAEETEQHLLQHAPPLHANAARVMFLAARKYDFIARKFQAAREIRDYYTPNERGLLWSKYWFWELRDGYEELEPLYAAAWRYENRESHLAANLERYHLAAQRNIERADRVYDATLQFSANKTLVPLDDIIK